MSKGVIMKKIRGMICFVVLSLLVIVFSSTVFAEERASSYNETEKETIEANDLFIKTHYIDMFNEQLAKDQFVEDNTIRITSKGEYGEEECIDIITYVVQNEQIIPASNNRPALNVRTTVSAVLNSETRGSHQNDGYDNTVSVYLYSTFYYATQTDGDGNVWYKMTSFNGGYTLLDNYVYVTSQYIWYGQSSIFSESGDFYTSNNPWSGNTNFSNFHFGAGYGIMGINYQVQLARRNSSSTWSYTLYNHLWI